MPSNKPSYDNPYAPLTIRWAQYLADFENRNHGSHMVIAMSPNGEWFAFDPTIDKRMRTHCYIPLDTCGDIKNILSYNGKTFAWAVVWSRYYSKLEHKYYTPIKKENGEWGISDKYNPRS